MQTDNKLTRRKWISIETSKNPMDKRLDFCAYFLALIKTLDEKKEIH